MADQLPVPPEVTSTRVRIGTLEAELFTPPGADASRLIVYYHGGGFVFGSSHSHRVLVTNLALFAGAAVLVPNYRLAPEHPVPAAHDDALAVYRWVLEQGYAPAKLAVAGDSAGGNLALATVVRARQEGLPVPAALGLFSPWLDLAAQGDSHREFAQTDPVVTTDMVAGFLHAYVGTADPHGLPPTPFHADFSGMPPTLVHVGSWERLRDDSVSAVGRMRQAGVAAELKIFEGMMHVWQLYVPILDEARESVSELAQFLRAKLA